MSNFEFNDIPVEVNLDEYDQNVLQALNAIDNSANYSHAVAYKTGNTLNPAVPKGGFKIDIVPTGDTFVNRFTRKITISLTDLNQVMVNQNGEIENFTLQRILVHELLHAGTFGLNNALNDNVALDAQLSDPDANYLGDTVEATNEILEEIFGVTTRRMHYGDMGKGELVYNDHGDTLSVGLNLTQGETIDKVVFKSVYKGIDLDNLISGHAGSDLILAMGGDDVIQITSGSDFIYGGLGHDRVDYTNAVSAVSITVGADGKLTAVGGFTGVDFFDSIESVTGSGLDDIFTLLSFETDGGQDYINFDGAGGENDELNMSGLGEAFTGQFNFQGFERVVGTDYSDIVSVVSMSNVHLHGGAGNDSLTGGDGDDAIYGGLGVDTIFGSAGQDQFFGNEAVGDPVSDDGAVDIVDYSASATAITIDTTGLSVEQINAGFLLVTDDGQGGSDILHSIESVVATSFNDILVTNLLLSDLGLTQIDFGAGMDTLDISNYESGVEASVNGLELENILGVNASNLENLILSDGQDGISIQGALSDLSLIFIDFGDGASRDLLDLSALTTPVSVEDLRIGSASAGTVGPLLIGLELLRLSSGEDAIVVDLEETAPVGSSDSGQEFMVSGGDGNDEIEVNIDGEGYSVLFGEDGNDTIIARGTDVDLFGGVGADTITILTTSNGQSNVFAGSGDDDVTALGGDAALYGGAGEDTLRAGESVSSTYELYGLSFVQDILNETDGYASGNEMTLIDDGEQDLLIGGAGVDIFHVGNGDAIQLVDFILDDLNIYLNDDLDGLPVAQINQAVRASDLNIVPGNSTDIDAFFMISGEWTFWDWTYYDGSTGPIYSDSNRVFVPAGGSIIGTVTNIDGVSYIQIGRVAAGAESIGGRDFSSDFVLSEVFASFAIQGDLSLLALDAEALTLLGNPNNVGQVEELGTFIQPAFLTQGESFSHMQDFTAFLSSLNFLALIDPANEAPAPASSGPQSGSGVAGDTIDGTVLSDTLTGTENDDVIEGYLGDDILIGGDGDDILRGGMRDDTLQGDAGADTLEGGMGADVLNGGIGNDTLTGGDGNDDYIYVQGDGDDVVIENSARSDNDRLILQNIDSSNVTIADVGANTIITIAESSSGAGDGGQITLVGGRASANYTGIDTIVFGDGSEISLVNRAPSAVGDVLPNVIDLGASGVAIGDEIIILASDLLTNDSDADLGEVLTLTSVSGISGTQVSMNANGDVVLTLTSSIQAGLAYFHYTIQDASGSESTASVQIDVQGRYTYQGTGNNDVIDGSVADEIFLGLDGDDDIYTSDGADDITGGRGDDYLFGDLGSDTYYYNIGDGNDVVFDEQEIGGSDLNEFVFSDVNFNEVSFARSPNNFFIQVDATGEVIQFVGQFGFTLSDVGTNAVYAQGLSEGSGQLTVSDGANNIDISAMFAVNETSDVLQSEIFPHLQINGTGNGQFDKFDISVTEIGSRIIVDIDGASFDTILGIFDSEGNQLAFNRSGFVESGGTGSITNNDSYIEFVTNSAGPFSIWVGDNDMSQIGVGETYTLNVMVIPPNRYLGPDLLFGVDEFTFADGVIVTRDDLNGLLDGTFNVAPIAEADTGFATTQEQETTISIASLLANDSDYENNDLSLISVQDSTFGVATIFGQNIVFTPEQGFVGGASFTYTISDGNGNTASATVAVLINPASDAASITNDILYGDAGGNVIDALSGNDIIYGLDGNDELSGSDGNDDLYGGQGNDFLYGGDGNDFLVGDQGSDLLDGGEGVDTVSYSAATNRVTVSFLADSATGAQATGDTLVSIENLIGSRFGDDLRGDNAINTLYGENGNDTLIGYNGDDALFGGIGRDILNGGNGADLIDGGAGVDQARYNGSTAAVQIDLLAGTASGGQAEGDILINIENLFGSNHNDILFGDTNNNKIFGHNGDDTLAAGGGISKLYGGNGNDSFVLSDGFAFVMDFVDDVDVLDVSAYGFSTMAEALTNLDQVGDNARFRVGDDVLFILDTDMNDLMDDIVI